MIDTPTTGIFLLTNCIFIPSYRTREQIQEVRAKRDPITGYKERILAANLVLPEELKVIF